jgi:toxin ParE1/3/4
MPARHAMPVRRLKKYPHLVFYVERSDHVDVWRVLHGMRDIPSWMQDPDLI